jgi:hypothetical protein
MIYISGVHMPDQLKAMQSVFESRIWRDSMCKVICDEAKQMAIIEEIINRWKTIIRKSLRSNYSNSSDLQSWCIKIVQRRQSSGHSIVAILAARTSDGRS